MKKIISENPTAVLDKKSFLFDDYIAIGIFVLYILVDFFPIFSSYTYADTQWLYLNILNFGVAFYIYYSKMWIENSVFKSFFSSKIIIFYIIFIFLSGISIIGALNLHEGFITILRYLVSFSSLFLLFLLFYDKKHTFLTLAGIVSILIFVECWNSLSVFFQNFGKMTINQMRANIIHHHDNKNIFASNILIKIPFVIFCILKTNSWKRILFSFIFFTTCFMLLFLGARAILAGFVLQIFIVLFGLIGLKIAKKIEFSWKIPLISLAIVIFSYVIYSAAIRKSDRKLNQNSIEALVQSSSPIATNNAVDLSQNSLDIRKKYWDGAYESILNKPFLGCGLGNWKIETLQYEQKWKPDNINSVHVHNDFLEVPAETGVLNGIVFILIFGFLILYNLKTILKSKEQNQIVFALLLLGSITALMVDSFFNFPLKRPTIQIVFMILILFTWINYYQFEIKKSTETAVSWSKNTLFVILMISFSSIYPNYLIYEFFKAIKITKLDNTALNLSYNEVNALFKDFPSIDETGTPINDIKTTYLIKENKFETALQLINESTKLNPYSLYSNSLRVDLYNKKMQFDSATFYAKKVYDLQPNYQVFYERYIQGLSKLKDTTGILKAFNNLDASTINSQHYIATFGSLINGGFGDKKSYEFLLKGIKQFPYNSGLLSIQADFNSKTTVQKQDLTEKELQIEASKTQNYSKIEAFYLKKYETNKNDFAMIENLGICYFQQKKYAKAVLYLNKVVDSNAFQNGKSEYVMAICYVNLGNKNKACELASRSQNYNFQDATTFINQNCK